MTMDILWAMSHPSKSGTATSSYGFGAPSSTTGTFAVPTPPYADGSWGMYEDFVGGVQFWGYGLVSGSGDGAVRMWDSAFIFFFIFDHRGILMHAVRTGQAHRTLLGHTAPITCLQFDELHIASGSLDRTIRVGLLSFDLCFSNQASDLGPS